MIKIIPAARQPWYDSLMDQTQKSKPITSETLIQGIIQDHPAAVLVFVRHGLQCAGCYMAPFHTLEDSARAYGIALDPLVQDLNRTVGADV